MTPWFALEYNDKHKFWLQRLFRETGYFRQIRAAGTIKNPVVHLRPMNIFQANKPFLIAGPCSAESESQMIEIAHAFREMPVNMIRAGIWKPRSRPGHFEGRGEMALPWLKQVKEVSGKPICIEVASSEQAELALKFQIDAIWIGARTSVNPFMVQEIADALKGSEMAVLVKNPVNPDIELWSGAVERMLEAGRTNIAAIHRGFSAYDPTSVYRNKPMWALPIELHRRYPELPIFCDISHISGKRNLLAEIAQRALDLDFDGLMIETHPDPDQALSDSAQQINPIQLGQLLDGLTLRRAGKFDSLEIEQIRQVIDTMDAEVVDIVGKRMELVRQLAHVKLKHNMPIFQKERWQEIIESRTHWGLKNQLKEKFMLKLFELIHDQSIQTQIDELQQMQQAENKD